mgnify:CR=1 FL=1
MSSVDAKDTTSLMIQKRLPGPKLKLISKNWHFHDEGERPERQAYPHSEVAKWPKLAQDGQHEDPNKDRQP